MCLFDVFYRNVIYKWPCIIFLAESDDALSNFANIRLNSFPLNINPFYTQEKYLINLISGVKYVLTNVFKGRIDPISSTYDTNTYLWHT